MIESERLKVFFYAYCRNPQLLSEVNSGMMIELGGLLKTVFWIVLKTWYTGLKEKKKGLGEKKEEGRGQKRKGALIHPRKSTVCDLGVTQWNVHMYMRVILIWIDQIQMNFCKN